MNGIGARFSDSTKLEVKGVCLKLSSVNGRCLKYSELDNKESQLFTDI